MIIKISIKFLKIAYLRNPNKVPQNSNVYYLGIYSLYIYIFQNENYSCCVTQSKHLPEIL